jgi:hypothetical protein
MQTRIDIDVTSAKRMPVGVLACFSVIGVILPALALVVTDGDVGLATVVATGITVYAGFRLSYLSFYAPSSILQLTFWVFVYCWLGLAASAQLKAGRFPWPAATSSDDSLWTEGVIIAGIAAYETGVRFSGKPTRVPPLMFSLGRPSLCRYELLTLACLAISCWAIYKQGGASEALRTRYERQRMARLSTKVQSERLTVGALQRVPPVVALLVSVYLFTEKKLTSRRERRLAALTLTALILFNLVANYPPALPRLSLGFILVSITALLLRNRAKLVPFFVLGMIFALTVLFPYTDYFRSQGGYSTSDIAAPTQKLIQKPDYDAFQMIANTVRVVRERGIAVGHNVLGSLFFFVPRAIWREKPYGTGRTVGELVGYSRLNLNLSSPLWAEFYYGGGIFFVIGGFWLYGSITRRAERSESQSPASATVLAYAAGVQIFLLRGDLMNSVAFFAPGALLLLMFIGKPVWSRSPVVRSRPVAGPKPRVWQPGLLVGKD